jgi:hypothetical protein
MPGPPSEEESYVICIEIPGPLKGLSIEEFRRLAKESATKRGGKLIEVKLENKKSAR